jgi:hypothetical protein
MATQAPVAGFFLGGVRGLVRVLAFATVAWGAMAALAPAPRLAAAEEKKSEPAYRVNDPTQVYVGNPRLFKKPAAVGADRVYRAIPEYAEILEKNLTDKDVRYHFLMKKASEKFAKAVQALAKDAGYDLVAGANAVSPANADTPAVPDETANAIAKLPA